MTYLLMRWERAKYILAVDDNDDDEDDDDDDDGYSESGSVK